MGYDQNVANFMRKHKVFSKRYKNVTDDAIPVKDFHKGVKNIFDTISNVDDFLKLFNLVNSAMYTKSHPLKLQHLTYHAFHSKQKYSHFLIAKKTGGSRTIHAPVDGLKNIQKTLNMIFQCIYKTPMPVHGFTENRSVVTNAKLHVGKNYVYNIDLKDFFPSIHKARIEKRLEFPPFNLDGEKKEIATLIARLVTQKVFEFTNEKTGQKEILSEDIIRELVKPSKKIILDGFTENINFDSHKNYAVLPQGAPTSPIFSNIICERLDRRLLGLAKKFGVKYTRYADDMTFSSMHNVYQKDSEFIKEMHRIIEDQRFQINPKKTRLQKRGYRQEVTGVIVNDKTNVSRRYIKKLRAMLYSIEKFGLEKAEVKFEIDYKKDKGHITNKVPSMLYVLQGKLEYLKMVKGEVDSTYLKLKQRLDQIINPESFNEVDTFEHISKENENIHSPSKSCDNHKPEELVKTLSKFTEDNTALKYITHDWDAGQLEEKWKNFDSFLTQVKEEWNEIRSNLYDSKEELAAKIEKFLFNNELGKKEKAYWGEHKITFGWSSPELKEWCQKGNDPFDFILPEKNRCEIDGKSIVRFSDVIDIFKNEIEIRTDTKNFMKIIRTLKQNILGKEFKLKFDKSVNGIEFYTDVQHLKNGLRRIFKAISKRTEYQEVKIKADKNLDEGYIDIYIIHVGSYSDKESSEFKEEILEGDFSDIKKSFCSLCDWSVQDKFSDGVFKIDFLFKNMDIGYTNTVDLKNSEEVEGFTQILRFYK